MADTDVALLRQELKDYKEQINKELETMKRRQDSHEHRLQTVEKENATTEIQFRQIMETLNKLNDETIPKLTKEIEDIKNKPVKRYDQVITSLISAIVGGAVTFGVTKIFS